MSKPTLTIEDRPISGVQNWEKLIVDLNAINDNAVFTDQDVTFSGDNTFSGETDLTGDFKLNSTTVTATATELNELDLSVVGAVKKVVKIPITAPTDGSETDTTFTLPAKAVIEDVLLEVTTAEVTGATKTLSIGTKTIDADGLAIGLAVNATGLIKPIVDMTNVDSASTTLGELLVDTDITNETAVRTVDVTSGGQLVTITAGSADFAELEGNIYLWYTEIA